MFSTIENVLDRFDKSPLWKHSYDSKSVSMDDAAALVYSNDNVFVSGNAASPRRFLQRLALRKEALRNVSVYHLLLMGDEPFRDEDTREHIRHVSFFVGSADRKAIQEKSADYLPVFLSEIPSLFENNIVPLDVVYVMVSPPNDDGFVSLGVECAASKAAIDSGKVVIAQVNENMPFTYGESLVPISKIHYIVRENEDLCELHKPEGGIVEQKIAQHISLLVEDGSTLQLGIGGIPNAIMTALDGKKDLGVHTEMFSDGMMEMMEKGIITNNRKTLHPGYAVATFVLGSKKLYEYANHNRSIKLMPTNITNNPFLISQNYKMVSINSAIEIDLTGQVCADSIGSKIYSGFGGQLDFVRGASASKNGKAIIAIPSSAKNGSFSRIVTTLKNGAGVVTTRGDVDYVVTEYGIASLKGKTLRQRAESLIAIAHPNIQPELESWFSSTYKSKREKQ